MQLTKFSDYALRILMFADSADGRLVTIDQMSAAYQISRAHLTKVVNRLTRSEFLIAVRGRSGGLKLAKEPSAIRLGDVVRATEPDFEVVECFGTGNACVISGRCKLAGVMADARDQFLATLDDYTLADIALKPRDFVRLEKRASSRDRNDAD